jgi:hypothetical protein
VNLKASTDRDAGTVPGFDALGSEAVTAALASIRRAAPGMAAWAERQRRIAARAVAQLEALAGQLRLRAASLGRRIRRTGRTIRAGLRGMWPRRRPPRTRPPLRRTAGELEPGVPICARPRAARTITPTAPAVMFGRTFSPHAPPRRPVHVTGHRGVT